MTFGVYVPPQAAQGPVPVLWYLSGLTCTHVNVTEKAGAQRICAELGVMRSEEHTSELQSLMRISYAVFCWKKKRHKDVIDEHSKGKSKKKRQSQQHKHT